MPDPVTIMMASFAAVRAGVAGAKSLAELGKDMGSLFSAIDDIKAEAKGAKKTGGSNAMQKFIALKQAEDTEASIKAIVLSTRGEAAWKQLKQMRAAEKQDAIQGRYAEVKRKNQILTAVGWAVSICITGGGGYLMYLFAMQYR